MSKGPIQRLALATALFATGAIVFVLAGGIPARQPTVATSSIPVVNDASSTLLPTVVVHSDADIPTLPTVMVRAPRPDRGHAAIASTTNQASAGKGGESGCSSSMTRCAGLEMPYYSFGKTLRGFPE